MSALTLMSVIAPSAPNGPQGPSGEDASGFQDLLTTLSGEDTAAPPTKGGATDTGTSVDARTDATDTDGVLVMPTQPPVPLVLPAAPDAPANSDVKPSGEDGGEDRPVVLPPTPAGASGTSDDPPVMPLQPVDKNPAPKTNDPQTPPIVSDPRPVRDGVRGPLIATAPQTDAPTAAALEAINAEARTGAPAASTAPTAQPPVVPSPAPLRALAERTSRPVEPSDGKSGGDPRATAPSAAAPAAATAVPPAASGPMPGAADLLAAAAAARDAAGEQADAGEPTPDMPQPGEGAAAQTQATAAPRETGVSQLSRATIEATAQIAAQILRRLEGRSTRFEMALTPDELGRVDVKLDIDSEGRLNARLAFDNPAAAADLRGRADELRRQLEDAGFHLAADAFEFAERDSGSSAFDRGQDARNGSSRAFAAASRLNDEIDVAQPPRWMALSLSPSGVDMKV
ncbi:MAG: flagellar hook-length control protein FliK [Brevundimonas sp.]|uniref:flagellar hook-length control protein FliK n=1 Tax=Brevundimonas sp. TaxID=1871086 RepID=UPI002723D3E5|nr:flagellar hook-length control protein FliK [Brevundimonas sp.]MDO9078631.1 flagellar hook-length control protein FliK [Brevundimonas sp.]